MPMLLLVETLTVMTGESFRSGIVLPPWGKTPDNPEPHMSRTIRFALITFAQATSLQEQR
jgi:hypothetical protein